MPRATTNVTDTERVTLKTCPPDGFVVLRRLNYGEMIDRRAMSSEMSLQGTQNGRNKAMDVSAVLQMINRKATEYEFSHCVVEHNLEDDNGVLLDFKGKTSLALSLLDSRVGDEISANIDRMNQYEEELPNSSNGSALASS